MAAGAQVVRRRRSHGKGGNVTAACEAALSAEPAPRLVLLCDGDLGESAARLGPLLAAVEAGECDLAVAAFARRVGGGFGLALGFARWAERRLCGFEASAPISGQRALRVETLRAVLPFARGFGMEIGMTVDAVRAGYRVGEYEIDLEHRATGRDAARLPPPRRPAPRLRPRLREPPPDPPFVGSRPSPVTAPRAPSNFDHGPSRARPCRCPR